MRPFRHFRPLVLLFPMLLALAGGCASPAPSEGGTSLRSGKILRVTLTFGGSIYTGYYYYFLMNVSNDPSAPGPIPVGAPISGQPYYSNGFATGSGTDKYGYLNGFTDFVLFTDSPQYGVQPPLGFGLYHVPPKTDSNDRRNIQASGLPLNPMRPSANLDDPASATFSFDIDLAQLFPGITDQGQLKTQIRNLRWIQVNVVATNIVPTATPTTIPKLYDSFGDTRGGTGSFLLLDVSQPITIQSNDAGAATEPADYDVYVSPPDSSVSVNPALNLTSWTIQILQQ
ncbi:MAG TPA: hypothetical protein VKU00_29065 [Chthonomonadaceae bacterium]|nr:hypothetical protein [Chthonomonadaceae bacterium]